MKSVMSHQFSQIPQVNIQRSKFNRSHGYKTTFDAGYLIPIFVDEALPGDTMNLHMTAFARLATPLTPIMDNLFLDSFFFAVPNRLVWDNWQKFNGEQTDPGDSTSFEVPVMDVSKAPLSTTGYVEGTLSDYFGIPTKVVALEHSSLWHRAYNLIYNEWFRDQNLIDSVTVLKTDGPDDPALYKLLKRGKRHDYFTSCLPWPQKGTAVEIPLGTSAKVLTSSDRLVTGIQTPMRFANAGDGNIPSSSRLLNVYNTTGNVGSSVTGAGAVENAHYPMNLYADLSTATAATINSLRQAFQLQKMFERDARGGTRYIEIIRSHFGVVSPDARLQRPEYLGGGTTMVNVNPVAQTSSTVVGSPQGNLAAIGIVSLSGHGF